MRTAGLLATSFAAALLLSSCAPSATPHPDQPATPSPTISAPAFLAGEQLDVDRLPEGVANTIGVDETSTRYEGDWDGHDVYLGIKAPDHVCLVTGVQTEFDTWAATCGDGNEVVTWKPQDGGAVKYLPMTSSATPQGWTRLSDYVFAM